MNGQASHSVFVGDGQDSGRGRDALARPRAMRDSARGEEAPRQNSSGIEGFIRHAAAAAAAKDARTGPAPARFPVTISEFKRAQTVLSVTLLVLCTIGSLVLDQTSLLGNRIFMPILTVSLRATFSFQFLVMARTREREREREASVRNTSKRT